MTFQGRKIDLGSSPRSPLFRVCESASLVHEIGLDETLAVTVIIIFMTLSFISLPLFLKRT